MKRSHKRCVLVVAGTSSGVGKTTISCGLMASFARRGYVVQPFKVGPDFLDGMHHECAIKAGRNNVNVEKRKGIPNNDDDDDDDGNHGEHKHENNDENDDDHLDLSFKVRKSVNLDGWMMGSSKAVVESFERHAAGSDVCIIEGVMGLFDSRNGISDDGSTAQIAKILGTPVVLVIDASMMARSAAAMALGYTLYDNRMRMGAIIVNRVGGKIHKEWIQDALEFDPRLVDTGTGEHLIFAGGMPLDKTVAVPERHLGLHMPNEESDDSIRFLKLAMLIEENIDLDSLLALGRTSSSSSPCHNTNNGNRKNKEQLQQSSLSSSLTVLSLSQKMQTPLPPPICRIGIAQDEAFCFYYTDNLNLLRLAGAELIPFSPIATKRLPSGLDALYIGGGYPELYAEKLEKNSDLRQDIHHFAISGNVILAECGGLVYLTKELITDAKTPPRKMCHVIPDTLSRMTPHIKMFYAEIEFLPNNRQSLFPSGLCCRGQKFHFSEVISTKTRVDHQNNNSTTEHTAISGEVATEGEEYEYESSASSPMSIIPQLPGAQPEPAGYTVHNTVASYYHIHFASNNHLATTFVESVIKHSSQKKFRAVSFVSAATEIIFALQVQEVLGGITSVCDYPLAAQRAPRTIICRSPFDAGAMTSEEVEIEMKKAKVKAQAKQQRKEDGNSSLPPPPGHWVIDKKELRRLSPSIAFVQNTCEICDPAQDDVLHALDDIGLVAARSGNGTTTTTNNTKNDKCKLVSVAPTTLKDLFKSITEIANVLDCPQKGTELQDLLSNRLQRVERLLLKKKKFQQRRPRVLSLEGLAPLCTGGHWLPDVKKAAGCIDALGDVGGAKARLLTWEEIVNADPDVLIISPCSASPSRTLRELHLLASAPMFWKLQCVQIGEIYVLDHGMFSRPGPRLIDGVEMLATLLNGIPAPPDVIENNYESWKALAYKYQCSTATVASEKCNGSGKEKKTSSSLLLPPSAMHCTTELAVRFSPCFGSNTTTMNKNKANDGVKVSNNNDNIAVAKKVRDGRLQRCNVTRSTKPGRPLPVDRSAHCFVTYRPNENVSSSVLLFGGEDSHGKRLCDLWKLCPPSKGWGSVVPVSGVEQEADLPQLGTLPTWEYIQCDSVADEDVPTPRSNFASVVCGDYLLVFGGWGEDNQTPVGNCELLHLETFCWTHCSTRGSMRPPPRGNPTLVYSENHNRAIMFGGWNASHRFNDLWCLDMTNWEWQKINCDGSEEEKFSASTSWPKPRTDHSAVLWTGSNKNEIMFVYGGIVEGDSGIGGSSTSEVWALDCSDQKVKNWFWYKLQVDGPLPPTRTSHTAAIVRGNDYASLPETSMIVTGGTDSSLGAGIGSVLCDAWILTPLVVGNDSTNRKPTWSKFDWTCVGLERCRHSMVSIEELGSTRNSNILIWGGYDGNNVVKDEATIWFANIDSAKEKLIQDEYNSTNGEKKKNKVIEIDDDRCNNSDTRDQEEDQKQRQQLRLLQERWKAEVPMREEDLPSDILSKARKSTLPGALYKAIHRYAIKNNRDTYIDPSSGYSVFTQLYLKRKPCCGNGCRHCPHGQINVPKKTKAKTTTKKKVKVYNNDDEIKSSNDNGEVRAKIKEQCYNENEKLEW